MYENFAIVFNGIHFIYIDAIHFDLNILLNWAIFRHYLPTIFSVQMIRLSLHLNKLLQNYI